MKQALLLLQWSSPLLPSPLPAASPLRTRLSSSSVPIASLASPETSSGWGGPQLTARERRQLRQERRDGRAGEANWREEVEDRLLHKPKKRNSSWMEQLNLDRLALHGPQWWVVRVSRVSGQEAAERLARSLIRNFPDIELKVYFPAVREKRKLKNGSYYEKSKPLFPGCIFLHCILNKDIHDFIKECDGVGGFLGSKVGNSKRQINRPKPVPADEMEAIFKQAKEEQEKHDQAFKEEQHKENVDSNADSPIGVDSAADAKPKRRLKKGSKPSKPILISGDKYKSLVPGVSVRVLSGPFTEFTGCLKELNHKNEKATVGFMLFGKESFVDLELDQIVAETM